MGRRARQSGISLASVAFLIVLVPAWLIGDSHAAGTLIAIGMGGLLFIAGFTPYVTRRMRQISRPARSYLLFLWIAVSVGLCLSFAFTGFRYAKIGVKGTDFAKTELRRTILAAGLFGACRLGAEALKKA